MILCKYFVDFQEKVAFLFRSGYNNDASILRTRSQPEKTFSKIPLAKSTNTRYNGYNFTIAFIPATVAVMIERLFRKDESNMVFEKLKSILIDQLDVEEEKVTLDALITEDLGADSLDVVDLIMSLEEEFDVEIPDDQIENIKTVGDVVKYIEEHIA